jgi:hypothetical protein
MSDSFSFQGFIARWLMAIFLVMATYNPSGYSYAHWIGGVEGHWVSKILTGLILAIIYATFVLATLRSLGVIGIAMWATLFLAILWFLIDVGLIEQLTVGTVLTALLIILANVIAVGLSWSYVRARLSGQSDTNNVTLP